MLRPGRSCRSKPSPPDLFSFALVGYFYGTSILCCSSILGSEAPTLEHYAREQAEEEKARKLQEEKKAAEKKAKAKAARAKRAAKAREREKEEEEDVVEEASASGPIPESASLAELARGSGRAKAFARSVWV